MGDRVWGVGLWDVRGFFTVRITENRPKISLQKPQKPGFLAKGCCLRLNTIARNPVSWHLMLHLSSAKGDRPSSEHDRSSLKRDRFSFRLHHSGLKCDRSSSKLQVSSSKCDRLSKKLGVLSPEVQVSSSKCDRLSKKLGVSSSKGDRCGLKCDRPSAKLKFPNRTA